MAKKLLLNELLLLIGTLIWGAAFIFQKLGGEFLGPFSFNSFRCYIAFIFLIIFYYAMRLNKKDEVHHYKLKDLILASLFCGIFLSLGMAFQQIGINLEGAGKAGFLTALYIIFVPLILLIAGKKVKIYVFIGALLAFVGLYVIEGAGRVSFSSGVIMLLLCALSYAFQIIMVSIFTKKCSPFLLCAGQFLVAGIIQTPLMLIFEDVVIENVINSIGSLLFLGVLSSGVGYTIQVYTQRYIPSSIATLIMSLESVFSLIFASIFLKESLDIYKIIGSLIILSAIIIAQIEPKKKLD